MEVITHSLDETKNLAKSVANLLKKGDILAFRGGLGVGKTTFINSLFGALGYNGIVSSPTFDIVNEYSGIFPLIHFDFYRLSGEDDLLSVGYYDYLDKEGIIAIEWSEILDEFIPNNKIIIEIETIDENVRKFKIYEACNENTRFR